MTEGPRQSVPDAVPTRLDTFGEIRARWAWVEAEVWTEAMLTALENGVQGGKWFSLCRLAARDCLGQRTPHRAK